MACFYQQIISHDFVVAFVLLICIMKKDSLQNFLCHLYFNRRCTENNHLIESSKQASLDISSRHWEHSLESTGKAGQPRGSSGFTEMASLYKKSQKRSGTSNRLAPTACSGISCPCGQLMDVVGPASASDGASTTFLFNHCCSLKI